MNASSNLVSRIIVTIGNGIAKDEFADALKKNNINTGYLEKGMMQGDAFTVASREERINLEVVSVSDLGFGERTCQNEIYERAGRLGWGRKCPSEVAPCLLLQCAGDQLVNESYVVLFVAMEAIRDPCGCLCTFFIALHCDASLWLRRSCDSSRHLYYPHDRFVFLARK